MSNARATLNPDAHYTYKDYANGPSGERFELIQGTAWAISPAPSWGHQDLAIILCAEIRDFLKGKTYRPFFAPTDVFLPEPGQSVDDIRDVHTIVQPDVGVVCNPSKIISKGIFGCPDLVMEIISPSSVLRDLNQKKDLYAKHGCREYWVWDVRATWVSVFMLQPDGTWDDGTTYNRNQTAQSQILPGFALALSTVRNELTLRD